MEAQAEYIQDRKAARRLRVPNHPKVPAIDHDIPPPVEARGGSRKFDHFYPFEDMAVGDSFWVPSSTYCTGGAVTKFARRSGWKFVTRGQAVDGRSNRDVGRKAERGTRVWRIA